jgi:hypothetical protein
MAFTIYRSTDGSAPVLSGTTGSLVALLDACLVNGYGAKAAAGWTKAFAGASKAAYRAPTGAQLYYRVQDDGPGAGTFKEARITGYETMSDVDTGTGPFPTAAQGVGGVAMLVCRKSITADATARAWIIIADARTVYIHVLTTDVASTYYGFMFGEYYSLLPGNTFNGMLIGRTAENSGSSAVERLSELNITAPLAVIAGHYICRAHTGTGGSVAVGKHGDVGKGAAGLTYLLGVIPYTNPEDGGIYISKVWVYDTTTAPAPNLAGRLRGFWHQLHPIASVADGDTVSGTGDLAGRAFLFVKNSAIGPGIYCYETSDTLETN